MEGGTINRFTAAKISINEINSGDYIKEDETGFSCILTRNNQKIRRVNLIGIIIHVENDNNYIIDDGTGKITIRSFDNLKTKYNIGDAINIIGKPREFGAKYILIEIIKEVDKKWLEVRKLELNKKEPKPQEIIVENVQDDKEQAKEQILNLVKKLDSGEGVTFEAIFKEKGEDTEPIINKLLENGELFQIKPGKLKAI